MSNADVQGKKLSFQLNGMESLPIVWDRGTENAYMGVARIRFGFGLVLMLFDSRRRGS
jgi:hypothetical protein